jgi:hypothetical protein
VPSRRRTWPARKHREPSAQRGGEALPRVSLWAATSIGLAALVAYQNSLTGEFFFDDLGAIVDNPTIRHLWPIWDALSPPPTGAGVVGRPLVNLSFALNYAVGGTQVWGYHAGNLAIHVLGWLTLFGIMRRTLRLPALARWFPERQLPLALAVALLWTVHPLVRPTNPVVSASPFPKLAEVSRLWTPNSSWLVPRLCRMVPGPVIARQVPA